MPYWAVAQTESQRENVAANFLKQNDYETYLPKIACKAGSRERIAPLFPSYLFVHIVDHWYSVRWTIGVLRLLMADERPATVPDKIITSIRKREGETGLVKLPKPPGLRLGQPVRIVRGSFDGHLGVYDGMQSGDRVRILLNLLGRSVPVSLATRDVRSDETTSVACT